MNFESSETRDEIALSDYLDPGDENLNPEELGRRIDDCLVHHIEVYTGCLIDMGHTALKSSNLAMGKIQEGMKEDPDYQAFAAYPSGDGISDPPARPISNWPGGTPCTVECDAPTGS